MKILFSFFLLMLSITAISQKQVKEPILKSLLVGVDWKSDHNLFSSLEITEYHIYKREKAANFLWGNSVTFTDSTFTTSYSASCGNDCFISVTGKYKFVSSNQIEVFVESIARNGMCIDESESPKKKFGTYEIIEDEKGYLIRKVTA